MTNSKVFFHRVGQFAIFDDQNHSARGSSGWSDVKPLKLFIGVGAPRTLRAMLENEGPVLSWNAQKVFKILFLVQFNEHDRQRSRSNRNEEQRIAKQGNHGRPRTSAGRHAPPLKDALIRQSDLKNLIEVVMDLGRQPEAHFPGRALYLCEQTITREDIEYVIHRVGSFTQDNRAGIERTLHRISCIRNRRDLVVGLTCRVGRAVYGTVDVLRDVIESGKSILLLGRPGVGKTTLLRESARVLSTELKKRVIMVDTSNEIAGDGDIPHPGIGTSRRMQVPRPDLQHAVMIEAVENHMPEVIVIDEIGTEAEAHAARTIAERGVQLIATAHGNSLDNILMNPTLVGSSRWHPCGDPRR